jgi:predicted acetyltransferase
MLNVSATQELARRVEKLERENASLQAELSRYQALEAENALLKVRMERFEAVLQRLETQQTGQQRAKGVVAEDSGLSMAD